ncbi:hypothetical protein OH76DRAFT_1490323 [Lentinus brumalis]|uniref:Uncharacterized protein n=1 Tax=Lentinus brumalis TaxID=2498619 RepID=A0A371CJE1_9APHY|nr:hypothetical protein OH76DRAFT_1490323 [Polyporus brumalis]
MAKRRSLAQKAATLNNLKTADAARRAKIDAAAHRLSEVLTASPALNDAPPDVGSELTRTVKTIGTLTYEMEKADNKLIDAEEAVEQYRQHLDDALGRAKKAKAHKAAVKKELKAFEAKLKILEATSAPQNGDSAKLA